MPRQPFVIRLHFYLPSGDGLHSLASGAHHIEYMGSREKGELLLSASGEEEGDRTTLASAAIHAKYAGERDGSLGYFGSMADDPAAAQTNILAAQGPVWRVIASVGEEDALAMGGDLITKDGWANASQPVVDKMIAQLGLDPAKVQWIAAAHRHQTMEHNPHIHLLFWEGGAPTRKTGQWTDAERRVIRKEWIHELYRTERQQLGQDKSEARAEARKMLIDLVARKNATQGFQRELTERLATLGHVLPGHGRLAYQYMPAPVKAQVESTIRWLWDADPSLKAQHDRFVDAAERMGTFYWHQDPAKTQDSPGRQTAMDRMRANAETDLIQRLAGPVLKAAQAEVQSPHLRGSRPAHTLVGALHQIMHRADREARLAAYWLSEQQWRHKRAEAAIAHSIGQQIIQ